MIDRVRIPIAGMTCPSCVAHVTKAARRVDGIESVKVDLGSDTATVAFDPEQTNLGEIAAAIRGAGYEPHIEGAEEVAALAPRGGGFFRRLRTPREGDHA